MKARKSFAPWAFLLPMAVPAASVVLVWKLFFHQKGLLNGALERLGLQGVNWMGSGASFWVDALITPAMTDRTIRTLVSAQAAACLKGECTTEEALNQALQSLNLYLSE